MKENFVLHIYWPFIALFLKSQWCWTVSSQNKLCATVLLFHPQKKKNLQNGYWIMLQNFSKLGNCCGTKVVSFYFVWKSSLKLYLMTGWVWMIMNQSRWLHNSHNNSNREKTDSLYFFTTFTVLFSFTAVSNNTKEILIYYSF